MITLAPRDSQFKVMLEKEELEQLKSEAEKAGFKSVAEFIRYMTIGEGRTIQADLKKILEKLEMKK